MTRWVSFKRGVDALLVYGLLSFVTLGAAAQACASSQPRVCSLSSVQMKDGQRDALREVSRSGKCDSYTTLAECPEAKKVDADWAELWSQWEGCR